MSELSWRRLEALEPLKSHSHYVESLLRSNSLLSNRGRGVRKKCDFCSDKSREELLVMSELDQTMKSQTKVELCAAGS